MYSMFFHNSPDGYRGLGPVDPHIPGNENWRLPPRLVDDLFYRADMPLDYDELAARLTERTSETLVQDYQYWVEAGWKKEHGTFAAVNRVSEKLSEEVQELIEEIEQVDERLEGSSSEEQQAISLEMGDVLWCVTALASCASADMDTGLKKLLYAYVMGTQYLEQGKPFEPDWRETAARLATKYDQLTLGDIDALIEAGFEPRITPVMNIFDPEEKESVHQHTVTLLASTAALRSQVQAQYAYGEESSDRDFVGYVLENRFKELADTIGRVTAQSYLVMAALAHRLPDGSLAEVVSANVSKISNRIEQGLVDKSDGDRQE